MVKRLPTMWETQVQSLGWEDPLEKELATHSSTLAWKFPWTEECGRLQSTKCKESDTTERLHFHFTKSLQCAWYYDEHVNMMISYNCHRNGFLFLELSASPSPLALPTHISTTCSEHPLRPAPDPLPVPQGPSLVPCNILSLFCHSAHSAPL